MRQNKPVVNEVVDQPLGDPRNAISSLRAKVVSLDDLRSLSADMRAKGASVVHAHGVFDLLHLGHVRHLEAARKLGDRLIVTITPDRFVNKGPGKPVFGELQRAEMLAALSLVDYVAVNLGPSAEPAIEAVRPAVYVKGSDYSAAEKDVTGKIVDERRLVESFGGRVVFTDDITFSSSQLINSQMSPFDPRTREFLDGYRKERSADELIALLTKIEAMKVLVVGEAIVDEYRYVLPMSKTPKENLVATLFQSQEIFAGGAIATANHIAGFCGKVDVLALMGTEDSYEELVRSSLRPNVRLLDIKRDGAPTVKKTRYIDPSYMRKLFEVYSMIDSPIPGELDARVCGTLDRICGDYDLVIVNDFGHGMMGADAVAAVCRAARFLAINAQTNSANFGYNLITKYPRADYVCIDAPEARLAVSDKYSPLDRLVRERLEAAIHCDRIVVTHGRHGAVGYFRGDPPQIVPAFADKVVDTVGAGDAVLAITSPLACAGASVRDLAFIGNVAGAIKVGIVGHRNSIQKVDMIKSIVGLLK